MNKDAENFQKVFLRWVLTEWKIITLGVLTVYQGPMLFKEGA
jgi:hypothetical protein